MPHFTINVKAGKPTRQTVGQARFLTLQSLGDAALVDVDIEVTGIARESLRALRASDRIAVGAPGFEAVTFTTATDCTIEFIASMVDVRLNNQEGQTVQANIVGTVPVEVTGPDPLPVSIAGPDPLPVATNRGQNAGAPLFVSGAILGDTPAATVTDAAPVAVDDTADLVLAADATRLEAVFYNQGPAPVALGMVGITWAKRAIVLGAGEAYIEARAAGKAWYAITSGVGQAATVTVQERKS